MKEIPGLNSIRPGFMQQGLGSPPEYFLEDLHTESYIHQLLEAFSRIARDAGVEISEDGTLWAPIESEAQDARQSTAWYAAHATRLWSELTQRERWGDTDQAISAAFALGALMAEFDIKLGWEDTLKARLHGSRKGAESQKKQAKSRYVEVRQAYFRAMKVSRSQQDCFEKSGFTETTVRRAFKAIGERPPKP